MLGARDNVIGNARVVGNRAKRQISNVQVEIIPEAGHMMSTERPEVVSTRILRFLRE
jgi:pimeloyl-ACP methyl ester carboxylesterase